VRVYGLLIGNRVVVVDIVARLEVEQALALMTADEPLITVVAQPLTTPLQLFCRREAAKLTDRLLRGRLLCAWRGNARWCRHWRW
jgi:predicted membrane GTPase involved in stress response